MNSVEAAVHIRRAGGRELQILAAATLKLRVPDHLRSEMNRHWVFPVVSDIQRVYECKNVITCTDFLRILKRS